jgi:uncharacterized protein (TIGR03643 family)
MLLTPDEESRIIEMAWEDRTPFEAIQLQFGLNESQVILLMRSSLKRGSFKLWRERVSGRTTKQSWLLPDAIQAALSPVHPTDLQHLIYNT